jgi:hypothetical protein
MKKILFTFILLVGISTANCALAQNADEYKTELKSFLKNSGSDASFTAILDQFYSMMGSGVDKTKLEAAKESIYQKAYDELINIMVPVYQKSISIADLKEINKFYQTPVGKRISAAQPKILNESMQVGQTWAMKVQGIFQEGLK